MSFQFGFSGDDIQEDPVESVPTANPVTPLRSQADLALAAEYIPRLHSIEELLAPAAPFRISYSLVGVELPSGDSILPRRDIYDVKYQLMRQEHLSATDEILIGTTNEDVRASTYEGGLKVWECSFDLIKVLSELDLAKVGSVLELGSGAALPANYILDKLLRNPTDKPVRLVVADYNDSVLRLVTAPNMLVTWWRATQSESSEDPELDITSELIAQFTADLASRNISIQFVSGAWSPQFVRLLDPQASFDLVLASETIYSLDTLPVFADTLLATLAPASQALVAAKKIYFGVGGGIPDFEAALDLRRAQHETVLNSADGVGRAVIRTTLGDM